MPFETPFSWVPDLEDAIEREPLTVSPDTPLVNAIALISQAHHQTCLLNEGFTAGDLQARSVQASCVLVMQENTILGILTERDVVRLTAQAVDLQAATVTDVMVHPVITLPERSVQDIFAALFLFRRYRIRHVPIVDDQDQLIGVISHESIRQVLRPANLLRFRRVSDVMATDVIQAPLTAPVLRLAQLMASHRVSCIVITQLDAEAIEQPVGIVTEHDIVQFQALQIDLSRTEAQRVMSSPLFLLSPKDSLWTAHQEMKKRRVGRLVVSWNWGKGLGIVTQTSLLRVFDPMEMYGVIENLQQTIQQLEAKQMEQQSADRLLQASHQAVNSTPPAMAMGPSENGLGSSAAVGRDRARLLGSLNHISTHIQQMIDDASLPMGQQRSKLQGVLHRLEQLHHDIDQTLM